jgi:hypothetical protein
MMKFFPVLILAALLAACAERSSDEQQVRDLIAGAEQAAEARDTSDLLALIADDYGDAQGRDRNELRGALTAWFAMHPKVELIVDVEGIEFPADGLAQARVTVRGLDLSRFDVGESVALAVELRRDDGEWRVQRADRVRR